MLFLRPHFVSRIRFKGHFGPEVDQVIPLTQSGATNVIGNPNKQPCLVDWSPELLASRKRKHSAVENSRLLPPDAAAGAPVASMPAPAPPAFFGNFAPFFPHDVKPETGFGGGIAPFPHPHHPPPPPGFPHQQQHQQQSQTAASKSASQMLRNNELLLYECAECGNKYGHKELIKFHLVKKHGVAESHFEAADRLKKILSPYNRFCKSVYESVRQVSNLKGAVI